MPTIQLHRNGVLALLGIVLLVALVGAVQTVAILRLISVLIVTFIAIVVQLVRHRESGIQSSFFSSQSTFNVIRHSRKPH